MKEYQKRSVGGVTVRLFLFVMLSLSCVAEQAQPVPQPSPTQDKPQDIGQEPSFRVNVDVVNIFFNVKGPNKALIPNLKKEDFEVMEDGLKQTIKYFNANSDHPLTLGILVDTSPSEK